jgi:hypothetical protein
MPAHAAKRALAVPPKPQPQWTEHLLDWKIAALQGLRQQLDHICGGPKANVKSYALLDAIRHVVAQEVNPDGGLGLHLQHMLTGAIAEEIVKRDDLMPRFLAHFPAAAGVPTAAFIRKYVNSRWWCQSLCEMDQACCADVIGAVESAIRSAQAERA